MNDDQQLTQNDSTNPATQPAAPQGAPAALTPKPASNKKLILFIVGLVVLAAAGVAAVLFVLFNKTTTTPTAENHAKAIVRERGTNKALAALYVNTRSAVSSLYIAPSPKTTGALGFAKNQIKTLEAMVAKLEENKASINGDEQSYKEFETFLATSKAQRDYISSLITDLTKTQNIFPQATKYSAIYGNPLNSFDLLSQSSAQVKATAITAKKELQDLLATLGAYKPTNELAKSLNDEYTTNFTNQIKYADDLIANDGDMTPDTSADNTKPVAKSSDVKEINTKDLNIKVIKVFDDFKKTFDAQRSATDTKLTDYLTTKLGVAKTDLDTKIKSTVEEMKAELGPELYASFQRSLK